MIIQKRVIILLIIYVVIHVYFVFTFKVSSTSIKRHLRRPSLVSYVDVFYGTGITSGSKKSTGNIFPVTALPHGMNHWSMVTHKMDNWFFDPLSSTLKGIRCTHQPSPWIGDYSYFDIQNPNDMYWDKKLSIVTPSYMYLVGKNSVITLSPTNAGAVLKLVGVTKLNFLGLENIRHVDEYKLVGNVKRTSVFKAPRHTNLHVVVISSTKWGSGTFDKLWIGTSFISEENAFNNVPHDVPHVVKKHNDNIWNGMLGKIKVSGGDLHKFYTLLYRCLLFPRQLTENGGLHYSPYHPDGGTFKGPLSTDSGFWDSYRTVYPLLHLAYPDIAKKTLDGWVNAIKEDATGKLAQWASPSSVSSMEGSMGEVSIGEGILNGAITDVDSAWRYLYNSCFVVGGGRASLDLYIKHGYVPGKVSLSLNYYLSDYVVSLVARKLDHVDVAQTLERRSGNWTKLFDAETKFFRPKNERGVFYGKFDQFKWMGPYEEGGPWQYRFYVPHDPVGLNDVGYNGAMCKYLNDMMTGVNTITNVARIHEEDEMQQHAFGQYSHNNQPVHHVLYLFAHVGCAREGQRWIRHVLETQYTDKGYSGDEDNGEMSAWYILSSIGLYSLVPGSGAYQIGGAPLFEDIYLEERDIHITNKRGVDEWQSIEINGVTRDDALVQVQLEKLLIRF